MNISYEYYRIFYYVAKYQSFTQAAVVLMNNQPNITRMIRKLENELGCTLFIRTNRGVTLTPEGEKLYSHVSIAVEQIEIGEELISMDRTLQSGTIAIGTSEVALRCFLLPVLNEFHRLYPGIRLRVLNQPTPHPIRSLRNGAVDIAVVTTPMGDTRGLKVEEIRPYRESAVCGSAFSELAKRNVSLSELSEYSIISIGSQTMTNSLYCDWFAKNRLIFSPDIEVATADQILPMVENNLGIGFVPEEYLKGVDSKKVFRLKLKEEIPKRSVCYLKRMDQPLNIAAREFERMLVECAQNQKG